jgi:hypothetical protein
MTKRGAAKYDYSRPTGREILADIFLEFAKRHGNHLE